MTAATVVVVGAINVDLVVPVPRLPRAGETVVGPRLHRAGGGKGANAAVAAARAGAAVRLVGAVGDDADGRFALADLAGHGVDVAGVVRVPEPTGVALIAVDPAGENLIAVGQGANAALSAEHVRAGIAAAGCVLVSTEVSAAAVAAAVRAATAAGTACVLNPAPVLPELVGLLPLRPLLTPNAGECAQLAALLGERSDDVTRCARALAARSGAPVVVTLGADGALVVSPDGTATRYPAHPVERVVDTTGAGDAFNGALAAALAAGAALDAAVDRAGAAAARSVTHSGARPPGA